jgi:light-regulated signal transduction histidine kinase (bacteriophytochrome)
MGVRFTTWQKATLAVLSCALPLSLALRNVLNSRPSHKFGQVVLFEELMRNKMEELSDNDIHITTVRSELLRFEEQRKVILGELTAMRDQLSQLVEAEGNDLSAIPEEDEEDTLSR